VAVDVALDGEQDERHEQSFGVAQSAAAHELEACRERKHREEPCHERTSSIGPAYGEAETITSASSPPARAIRSHRSGAALPAMAKTVVNITGSGFHDGPLWVSSEP
jgi:hypothetical protein